MGAQELASIAMKMVAPGKGILAADESGGTIKKRFDTINVESTENNRRFYREMLFTTEGIDAYIGGVILFDETIRQNAENGTPLTKLLEGRGIVPGIKVDKGAKPLSGAPGETVTEGLDGLRERLKEYYELGARFTKWRAVINIGEGLPTPYAIHTNAHALARYAALSQEIGLVPIVEPEVLMDGGHTIERCYEASEATLKRVFDELGQQRVALEGMILKPNMILSGKNCATQAGVKEVADQTVRCLKDCVPDAVPGIAFLSGGQSDETATAHLNAMNAMGPHPWELSFSYGRALQAPALQAWRGDPANRSQAQKIFQHRCKCNSAARSGAYTGAMEKEVVAA